MLILYEGLNIAVQYIKVGVPLLLLFCQMFPYYMLIILIPIASHIAQINMHVKKIVFSILFILFVFVSTNMRTFEQINVKLMLRKRYQIIKYKFNICITLNNAPLQNEDK